MLWTCLQRRDAPENRRGEGSLANDFTRRWWMKLACLNLIRLCGHRGRFIYLIRFPEASSIFVMRSPPITRRSCPCPTNRIFRKDSRIYGAIDRSISPFVIQELGNSKSITSRRTAKPMCVFTHSAATVIPPRPASLLLCKRDWPSLKISRLAQNIVRHCY